MATRDLLGALSFRALKVTLNDVTRIVVRYGVDYSKCKGHASARCVVYMLLNTAKHILP
jgi:hypothetical protein